MNFSRIILSAILSSGAALTSFATNYAWPQNYSGVMLQGFYWDSYDDTKWTNLTAKADEYSKYFSLIWVPNPGKAASNPGMGYDPVYWFSNLNSSFGNEASLKKMIATYKEKGTGIIADVVVNHRSGVSNWTNFPAETWRGVTYKLGPQHICSTDEVKDAPGQAKPTGAPDTGDDFGSSRDLDHTHPDVQDAIKAYTTFLLEDLGFTGFRYDMVKGFAPQYVKMYNEASKPQFSVGEYFDASYDAVKWWIEGTSNQSAAFDFPFKYAVNEAFHSGDLSKLVWKANGTNDQPAGMIHFGFAQYAVTFVDNHDTYRDGSKFNGNVPAANAFMLFSPGTPCVFLKHYLDYTKEIQKLIEARNSIGIHNQSPVKVLRTASNCYMAEITGKTGKAVVKIGPLMISPDGYSDSQIVASGNDYCVWVKSENTPVDPVNPPAVSTPSEMYILGNLPDGHWTTDRGIKMEKDGAVFQASNVVFEPAAAGANAYFSFVTTLASSWDGVNGNDRFGPITKDETILSDTPSTFRKFAAGGEAASANSWCVTPGTYNVVVDFRDMNVTVSIPQGIDVVSSDATDIQPEYYTLQGVRVQAPSAGALYIVRRGAVVTKEYIR